MNANHIVSTEYDGALRKLYSTECEACHKVIWVPKNVLKKRRACSRECTAELRRSELLTLECANCGKTIARKTADVENSKNKKFFCDRACKDSAQRLDGNCPEIRPSHYGKGEGKWDYRKRALIDNKACSCGESRTYLLTVHHRDGNRANNVIENLEVVCYNCHALRHLKRINGEWVHSTQVLTSEEDLRALGVVRAQHPCTV